MSVSSKSSNVEQRSKWEEVSAEAILPNGWKKFVCVKNGRPIPKLVKYINSSNESFKNLESALSYVKEQKIQDLSFSHNRRRNSEVRANSDEFHSSQLHYEKLNNIGTSSNIYIQSLNYTCNVCHISFPSNTNLEVHRREKHREPRIKRSNSISSIVQCNLCGLKYKTKEHLEEHLLAEHSVEVEVQDEFICPECKISFDSEEMLQIHYSRIHHLRKRDLKKIPTIKQMPPGPNVSNMRSLPTSNSEVVRNNFDNFKVSGKMMSRSSDHRTLQLLGNYESDTEDSYESNEEDRYEYSDNIVKSNDEGDCSESYNEYYEDDDDDDEIEEISSTMHSLPLDNDIEVVHSNVLERGEHVNLTNSELAATLSKYSHITITNDSSHTLKKGGIIMEYDDDDHSSDLSEEDVSMTEEITLDDDDDHEPAEITLDEDDDERVGSFESDSLEEKKIVNYEVMIGKSEYVRDLVDDPIKLIAFQQHSWFSMPTQWRPSKVGEAWNGSVAQICFHYKLHEYPIKPTWRFDSWNEFNEFISEPLQIINPGKTSVALFKLKKAMWLKYLDPIITADMKITMETIDECE